MVYLNLNELKLEIVSYMGQFIKFTNLIGLNSKESIVATLKLNFFKQNGYYH
jgi:hypothetical protein